MPLFFWLRGSWNYAYSPIKRVSNSGGGRGRACMVAMFASCNTAFLTSHLEATPWFPLKSSRGIFASTPPSPLNKLPFWFIFSFILFSFFNYVSNHFYAINRPICTEYLNNQYIDHTKRTRFITYKQNIQSNIAEFLQSTYDPIRAGDFLLF